MLRSVGRHPLRTACTWQMMKDEHVVRTNITYNHITSHTSHHTTDTTSTRTAQHTSPQHPLSSPLPVSFPSPHKHTHTRKHHKLSLSLPVTMTVTNDHSFSQLSVHRAGICPEGQTQCMGPFPVWRKKLRNQYVWVYLRGPRAT